MYNTWAYWYWICVAFCLCDFYSSSDVHMCAFVSISSYSCTRCISIHPSFCSTPTGEMLSFLSDYSIQTTCACLPERNFSFLPRATLFNRISKRICFTGLVPEMHFLEILESLKTALAVESLGNDDGNMKWGFFLLSIVKSHSVVWPVCLCGSVWGFFSSVEIWGLDGAHTAARRVSWCATGPCWWQLLPALLLSHCFQHIPFLSL